MATLASSPRGLSYAGRQCSLRVDGWIRARNTIRNDEDLPIDAPACAGVKIEAGQRVRIVEVLRRREAPTLWGIIPARPALLQVCTDLAEFAIPEDRVDWDTEP